MLIKKEKEGELNLWNVIVKPVYTLMGSHVGLIKTLI